MEQTTDVIVSAHRANIRRYRQLLRTHLTELERNFVKKRLTEEEAALATLSQPKPQPVGSPSPYIDPTHTGL